MPAVPTPPVPRVEGPRFALRRKGQILFLFVSLYVVLGATLLVAQTFDAVGSRQDLIGQIEPLIWVGMVSLLLGLTVFGAFLTLFLGRLASDLGRLQNRALEVANGFRGAPLAMERDDEVGLVAAAVDKMAADLTARETEIACTRLEQFHNERMRLLGGIAAGLAHEIGNPVAAIVAIASEAKSRGGSGRDFRDDAGQLLAMAQRLSGITRRLALAAGLRSKQRAPIALNPVLDGVASLVALDDRFRNVEMSVELDRNLPMVVAAEDDVVQLALHLLVNAAESFEAASPPRPRIVLATSHDMREVRISVRDNGRGMDQQTLERAFVPLFTTKPAGKGNGLGLDACRRIMAGYGGGISLASEPGKGTEAKCCFPVTDAVPGEALS